MLDTLYTTAQAAERLGLSAPHVRRLAEQYGVGQRLGKRVLVFSDDDLKRLDQRKRTPGPKPAAVTEPNYAPGRGPQWRNRQLFAREGSLYVVAMDEFDAIAVWESTDNGNSWHAPSQETLRSLIGEDR